MRKTAIKGVLFSMIGLSALPALAQSANDLILLEDLPLDVRAAVHASVVDFLNQNPQLINEDSTIALDSKGTIYVLDKNMVAIGSHVGQPSCIAASVGQPSCIGSTSSVAQSGERESQE